MSNTRESLTLAVGIGEAMLRCGAEIYRVEDSVTRILHAYGVEEFDVYVLSNGIFASANENQEDACSVIRHVSQGATHLGRLTSLNQLTRDVCSGRCGMEEAKERLLVCGRLPEYPTAVRHLACAVGCAAFTLLFGGGAAEAVYAFFVGVLEQALLCGCAGKKISRFLTTVYASLLVSVLAIPAALPGSFFLYDKIVIGSIMPLVPGIVLTTSIRDFYNSDYLSGTIHLIDAFLTALCIAVGVTLPMLLFRYLGGGL